MKPSSLIRFEIGTIMKAFKVIGPAEGLINFETNAIVTYVSGYGPLTFTKKKMGPRPFLPEQNKKLFNIE